MKKLHITFSSGAVALILLSTAALVSLNAVFAGPAIIPVPQAYVSSADGGEFVPRAGAVESAPFTIDDLGSGNYTWAEAVLESWCTGAGKELDPYVVSGLSINGENATLAGIYILNSDKFIVLRDIDLFGAQFSGHSGMRLENVSDCRVENVRFTDNYQISLHLLDSSRIAIINCSFVDNFYGIRSTGEVSDILLENNLFDLNGAANVEFAGTSHNLIVKNNRFYNSSAYGLGNQNQLQNLEVVGNEFRNITRAVGGGGSVSDVYIHHNDMVNTDGAIYYSSATQDIRIEDNYIFNSTDYGIGFQNTHVGGTICNNTIENTAANAIHLYWDVANKMIENNTIINCQNGIYGNLRVVNNHIAANNIFNTTEKGIVLNDDCDMNVIRDNIIELTGSHGISIEIDSEGNEILYNTISQGAASYGIYVWFDSHYGKVNNNEVSGHHTGIRLSQNDFSEVTGNSVKDCQFGIMAANEYYSDVIQNIVKNCSVTGLRFDSGQNIKSTLNWLENNTIGLFIAGSPTNHKHYNNYLVENGINADISDPANFAPYGVGSYWSDYGGSDTDGNGLGDTPYLIAGTQGETDIAPLWDTNAPEIVQKPSDLQLQVDALSFALEWLINDSSTLLPWYSLYVDGVKVVDHQPWVAGENITLSAFSLMGGVTDIIGDHVVRIWVSDGFDGGYEFDMPANLGGRVEYSFTLTVEEATDPGTGPEGDPEDDSGFTFDIASFGIGAGGMTVVFLVFIFIGKGKKKQKP